MARKASEDSSHPSAKIPGSLGNLGVSWEEVEDWGCLGGTQGLWVGPCASLGL